MSEYRWRAWPWNVNHVPVNGFECAVQFAIWARTVRCPYGITHSPPSLNNRAQGELMIIDSNYNIYDLPCGDVSSDLKVLSGLSFGE